MAKKQIKQSEQKSSKPKKLTIQKILIGVLALAVIGFFIVNNFITNEPMEDYTFTKEGELTFTDSFGALKAKIDLEIADNEYERQLGLMNRKEMKRNEGMLLIFPRQDYQSFWMRNTLISLKLCLYDQKEIEKFIKTQKSFPRQAIRHQHHQFML